MPDPSDADIPTLYDWAGGDQAFARLLNSFYDRVEHDELIASQFPGGVSREHREHGWPSNSQPGADVVKQAPVPSWGWGRRRRSWA